MMKKVSVIIPMYNSEKYIRQCLDSVLRQTFRDMEIIVIDDGSTDRGPEICEELGRTDDRIRLYCQENGGVSAARNYGIEMAGGEYIFFLDSDDVIHPFLLGEMIKHAEEQHAELVFCDYSKLTSGQISEVIGQELSQSKRVQFQAAYGKDAEEWFHIKYTYMLAGIGGKLVLKNTIRNLRFDNCLKNGEDTFFMYKLIGMQILIIFLEEKWYYYRIHQESVTQSMALLNGESYLESSRRIRNEEYLKNKPQFALTWERLLISQIKRKYIFLKSIKDKKGCRKLKKIALEEKKHPLFPKVFLSERILFYICLFNHQFYWMVNKFITILFKYRESIMMKKKYGNVGIITFHCSNNYGAILQAYGLKCFLRRHGIHADIVRYEPPYMTGRHWWIPYAPLKGVKGKIWCVTNMWRGFRAHIGIREDFSKQLLNMNYFRYKYLVDKNKQKILFASGLKKLKYKYYVVGSDQIWNPDITCGLKKVYFGAFQNKWKQKVISYAASFGGSGLAEKYDEEFSKLIKYVDFVSVREKSAIPYIKKFCDKEVYAVLDPVFFLKRDSWEKVERIPENVKNRKYIFVYITEQNQEMLDYAKILSQDIGLPVIGVCATQRMKDFGFEVDYTAGPAELLGYIHLADYVVSNSFHAVAFSIIYEKQFLAFVHRTLGDRVRNVLIFHGLQERLCEGGGDFDIDAYINWEYVRQKTKENVKLSGDFLMKSMSEIFH